MTRYRVNYRLHKPRFKPVRAHFDFTAVDENHAMAMWRFELPKIKKLAASVGASVKFSGLFRRGN